ncbi:MAG: FHA domain-containing protein [Gemmataceae bacterium]|nr:FHA domain-containing protein [Gemmata sp.]MDW8198079.1 FHA domain-containing protein [Gemmataceae bacterium]
MNDPLIAQFKSACGATGPLQLRVDLADGTILAEGSVDQPFTLVGRDDACDVTLSDSEVNMRHAWLQVLGGHVFAVDLGSRTGLIWPGGTRGSNWLMVGRPVRIGPFLLHIQTAVSDEPSSFPTNYNPLAADMGVKTRPTVSLEFRNGKRAKDRWNVNRLITLVGRAPDCKIHLNADDIAPYHCGLVLTRQGLWVVDLSGRGVVVNGERMRVAPLPHGAELWAGRFLIACQYLTPLSSPAPTTRGNTPTAAGANPARTPHETPPAAESVCEPITNFLGPHPETIANEPVAPLPRPEEIDLGEELDATGLPASHILSGLSEMTPPEASGALSNPISVSTSAAHSPPPSDTTISSLLRRLADSHTQATTNFQQSLVFLEQLFSRLNPDQRASLHRELHRIYELHAEIETLQAQLVRETIERATTEHPSSSPPTPRATAPESWVPPSTHTPIPPSRPETTPPPTVRERLQTLLHDRAARWQALLILFAGN